MYLKLVTPPTDLPLTLEEAKTQLRVDGTEEDAYITALIQAVTNHVQNVTNRQLMLAEYRLSVDRLPSSIPLPRPPFATISNFTAKDAAGEEVVFEDTFYTLDDTDYTTIRGVQDSGWYASTYEDVKITYTAGYESAEAIPSPIKQAMLLLLTYFYENRGDSNKPMPAALDVLLGSYRIFSF